MFNKRAYILSVIYDFGYKDTVFPAFTIIFIRKTFDFLRIFADKFAKPDNLYAHKQLIFSRYFLRAYITLRISANKLI